MNIFNHTNAKSLIVKISAPVVILAEVTIPALAVAAASSEPDKSSYQVLDEIIVSARKRDETMLSTPVAMSALNAEQIERYQSDDLASIGEMVPSVIVGNYKTNGGGSITMRGISTSASQIGFEQAVSVAIDGVQSSDGRAALLGFFDLKQVEVLKGPQALFFGKNSVGGVISLTSADPTPELEVTTKMGYEFVGDETTVEAAISGPLTEELGGRLAFRYRNLDGWLRNDAKPVSNPFYVPSAPAGAAEYPGASEERIGEEELLGRLTLVYDNDDDFSARFKFSFARLDDAGTSSTSQNIGPCADGLPRMFGVPDPNGECIIDNHTSSSDIPVAIADTFQLIDTDGKQEGRLKFYISSLELNKTFSNMELSLVTGYNFLNYWSFAGFDQTGFSQLVPYEDQTTETWSQEVRLLSNFDSPINFMIGAFYQNSDIKADSEVKLLDAWYNAAENRFIAYEGYARQSGETLSAFGQVIWDVTDTIEFAGGLRWTDETKEMDRYNTYGFGPFNNLSTIYPGSDVPGLLTAKYKDDNISPEVTVTWRPSDDLTYYIAYKTGYKSGGFALTNPFQISTTLDDIDFDSEKAEGFEAGIKGRFFDNRFNANLSVFMFDFDDLQVSTYDPDRVAFTISNAGSLKQRGFDLDFNFQATESLSLHGALSYVHNRYQDFIGQCYSYNFGAGADRATATAPANCSFVDNTSLTLQQDFDGRAPARSPAFTGNFGVILDVPISKYLLQVAADAIYSDKYFASETFAPTTLQNSFWRFNARIDFSAEDSNWVVSVIGKNLSNKHYLMYAADRTGGTGSVGIGEQRGVVSRGREIALQASYKF